MTITNRTPRVAAPPDRGRAALVAVALGGAALLAVLTGAVLNGRTAALDDALRVQVHGCGPGFLPLMEVLTALGDPRVLSVLSALLFVAFLRCGRTAAAAVLASAMGGAAALGLTLKLEVQRPRPVPFHGLPTPPMASFPSGHALSSACFFLAVAFTISPLVRPARRVALWAACSAMALGVGVSRVYLGVHWPSDVLGGWLAGVVWMSAVRLVFRSTDADRASPQEPEA